MRSYLVRARCSFGGGELVSLAKIPKSLTFGGKPEFDGEIRVVFISEFNFFEILEPRDIVNAAEFLRLDVSKSADASIVAFCHVLATGFLDWTSEVISGNFRHDIKREPMLHRSGFDTSLLEEPIHLNDKVKFYVRYDCDGETRIAKVEFNLKTAKLDHVILAAWKDEKIYHKGDDGQVLGVSWGCPVYC